MSYRGLEASGRSQIRPIVICKFFSYAVTLSLLTQLRTNSAKWRIFFNQRNALKMMENFRIIFFIRTKTHFCINLVNYSSDNLSIFSLNAAFYILLSITLLTDKKIGPKLFLGKYTKMVKNMSGYMQLIASYYAKKKILVNMIRTETTASRI